MNATFAGDVIELPMDDTASASPMSTSVLSAVFPNSEKLLRPGLRKRAVQSLPKSTVVVARLLKNQLKVVVEKVAELTNIVGVAQGTRVHLLLHYTRTLEVQDQSLGQFGACETSELSLKLFACFGFVQSPSP
jgi:hypothetical protein